MTDQTDQTPAPDVEDPPGDAPAPAGAALAPADESHALVRVDYQRAPDLTASPPPPATPPGSAAAVLHEWAASMAAAAQLARSLVHTPFAPAQYRPGVPIRRGGRERTEKEAVAAAAAAIMAGAGIGLDPLQSLSAYHVVEGVATPSAVAQRAAVLAVGGVIEVVESTDERAVVRGRRRDGGWQSSTWTTERARRMGLLERDQWRRQPGAMLVARATSEVARWIAADRLLGLEYSPDEVPDANAAPAPAAAAGPTQRRSAAEILGVDTGTGEVAQ